jgi:hypothetical protein
VNMEKNHTQKRSAKKCTPIWLIEPVHRENIGLVQSEIAKFVGNGQKTVSVVFIKNK